jgi:hypothetical protein
MTLLIQTIQRSKWFVRSTLFDRVRLDVRKYLVAVEAIIVVMLLAVVSGLLLTFFAKNNYIMETGLGRLSIRKMVLMSTVFDTLVNITLYQFFTWQAQKARYQLLYLSPLQFRTLTALAEVVIEGDGEKTKAHRNSA